MKKLSLALALLGACAATSTFAATGTITFNGELVAGTCNASVNGSGNASQTVTLPTASTAVLTAATHTTGITPFKITLTGAGCTATSNAGATIIATPYFEYETAKVNTNGRLINTAGATNVDVQLLNNAQNTIDVTTAPVSQLTSTPVAAGTDTNDFNYFARYYATGTTTAGLVTASVSYSIIYK